ncbi:MAG: 30S ribosomal protein S12 methylthiotransferase RimO [Bacteroidetes bacterium]|nr:30S ribosomal protein S12 methylthiotransferase RimO [Bacteroidota bacterium]
MKTRPHATSPRINVITLGCSKNLVDSEVLLTQLQGNRLDAVHEQDAGAGVVVVNTCGFIDRAKEESVNTILDYVSRKGEGLIEKVFVTGCLSERYRDELREEIPEVDGWFGTRDMPDLVQALGADYKHELVGERKPVTDGHYAYLKIAEGCDRPCSFCAIPLMRGGHQSRDIESLVQEATWLAHRGVREVMLIAQDLTYYGIDLYGKRRLADLLNALADVPGLDWIRLHYAYPSGFPLEVLEVMARRPNICNYLDIPLQHAADPVLKAMRRGITRARTEELIATIRARVPGIALRTTMLVGHPGETDTDHAALLDFIRQARFERLGVFTYSHEDNTHAAKSEDTVPQEVKEARAAEVMAVQQEISAAYNRSLIGRTFQVLVDRAEGEGYVGRTEYDSPEVDNEVHLQGLVQVGHFCQAEIYDATEYDLFAKVVDVVPAAQSAGTGGAARL